PPQPPLPHPPQPPPARALPRPQHHQHRDRPRQARRTVLAHTPILTLSGTNRKHSCSISTTGNPRRLPGSDMVAIYAPPVALMAVLRNDHPEGLRKPERHEGRERYGNRTSTPDDQPPPPRPPAEGKRRDRGTRHRRVRGRPPPAKGVPASGHDDRPFPPCSGCHPGSVLERQHRHGHTDP